MRRLMNARATGLCQKASWLGLTASGAGCEMDFAPWVEGSTGGSPARDGGESVRGSAPTRAAWSRRRSTNGLAFMVALLG